MNKEPMPTIRHLDYVLVVAIQGRTILNLAATSLEEARQVAQVMRAAGYTVRARVWDERRGDRMVEAGYFEVDV